MPKRPIKPTGTPPRPRKPRLTGNAARGVGEAFAILEAHPLLAGKREQKRIGEARSWANRMLAWYQWGRDHRKPRKEKSHA